jgi:hypothetical protein
MRRTIATALFACFVATCSAPPDASIDRDRADIQAIYDAIAAGIEARDIDRVTAFSQPDAAVEYADGTRFELAQWKDNARTKWANFTQASSDFAVATVTRNAQGAIVTYVETDDMVVLDPATKQEHHVEYQGEWCAQLQSTPAGWRLHRSVEQSRRVKLDGTLVDETQRKPADQ